MPLANICGMSLTSLTNPCVKDIDGLECLPDWLFYNNQDLSELKILNCPKSAHPQFSRGVKCIVLSKSKVNSISKWQRKLNIPSLLAVLSMPRTNGFAT